MLEVQKRKLVIESRQSEIRARLGAISLLEGEALTDAIRTERDGLATELRESEPQLQAAIAAVQADESARVTEDDGEGKELRELRGKISLGRYVAAAIEQRAATDSELEYNQARQIAGNRFPLELLAPAPVAVPRGTGEAEHRATTGVDTAVVARSWLDRLFAGTASQALGVTMESVPAGVASFPVTTAGAGAAQRGRAEAAADAAWTVGVTELKPTRNAVRAVFSIEDAARLPGLEDALQRDLSMALAEGIDRVIFLGDDGANENTADITGLSATAGLVAKAITQTNKVKGANVLQAFAELIDGKAAMTAGDLRGVFSVGANTLWARTLANTGASVDTTIAEFLRRFGLNWVTRADIDNATADGDFAAFVGLNRGIDGAGVAAVWEAGELVRDMYTGAAKGEVSLTLSYLWNFGLPRAANFARVTFGA